MSQYTTVTIGKKRIIFSLTGIISGLFYPIAGYGVAIANERLTILRSTSVGIA